MVDSRTEAGGSSTDAGKQFTTEGSSATGSPFRPPSITLPKEGGAIRGIGEKVAASLLTSTEPVSAPTAVSPGRSGFDLQLSFPYDSDHGNAPNQLRLGAEPWRQEKDHRRPHSSAGYLPPAVFRD